jgi:hypothetical protein
MYDMPIKKTLKKFMIMNLPATELRGIRGMESIIIPPHPRIKYGEGSALSLKGRGGMVYPEAELRGIY